MPFVEINGKKIAAEAGAMIIEVADLSNIQIPRFCYHKKLSIAANCRMCLVEVERSPKPLPACATPVTEGMKIWTRSPGVLQAQKSVMEFLLINHPLDCPVCDQGGECELQDLSLGYGADASRYREEKRIIKDKNMGPLIATDLTRCIQCTRCIRFGTEISGIRELGALGRGESLEIGTYIEQSVDSEVSGNIIDLCPVGALTSKPFRFSARGWELRQTPSIAAHDCIGSHLYLHTRLEQVMRVVPRENESINEIWISDRDRFSYEGLSHSERLLHPKIKQDGQWKTVSWQEALDHTAQALLHLVKEYSPNTIGALLSPNATLEEGYGLQQLMRQLGTPHIDHRLRQQDFRDDDHMPIFPTLGKSIAEIEQQDLLLLIGSDVRREQPVLGLKLRKMVLAGGKLMVINPLDSEFNVEVALKTIVSQGALVQALARVAKAIVEISNSEEAIKALDAIIPNPVDIAMAKQFMQRNKKLILLGALSSSHPSFSQLLALSHLIAKITGATVGLCTEGANSAGAWLSGCVPHRLPGGVPVSAGGLNALEMFAEGLKAYVLVNIEPTLDCLNGTQALRALEKAELVVLMTPFETPALQAVADVLLPMAPFSETSGTFVNGEGKRQYFKAAVKPLAESLPGVEIIQGLANALGFSNVIASPSISELGLLSESEGIWPCPVFLDSGPSADAIIRLAPVPLYATDSVVRRAQSLQKTKNAGVAIVSLNSVLATRLQLVGDKVHLQYEETILRLPFVLDETLPDNTVMLPAGLEKTVALGVPYSRVRLQNIGSEDV